MTPPPTELICRLPADSRIRVIGLGGVGCIVLQFLALFLRSLRIPVRLVLIDGDDFELSNESRMQFRQPGNKAEVKAIETLELLGPSDVAVVTAAEFVGEDNIDRLIRSGDHVFLCVDNHETRRLVSNHCEQLENIALFSGGNDGVNPPQELGTYGNAQVFIRTGGKEITAPLTRFHPEIAAATGQRPGEANCTQLAVSTPQILMANLAVASHLLNAFFAYTCNQLGYQEVQFDILAARALPQFPSCRQAENGREWRKCRGGIMSCPKSTTRTTEGNDHDVLDQIEK